MTYNTTDEDADGVVDSDVDNSSVSTNDVAASNSITLAGTTRTDWPSGSYSDTDARNAVEGETDVADLSGALGSDGQVPFSDGTNVAWGNPASASTSDPTVYTSDYSGTTLDVRFQNAVNDLEAGKIVVPGAGSGDTNSRDLTWASNVTVDVIEYRDGLEVEIMPGTRITYTGSGEMLKFRGNNGTTGSADVTAQIEGATLYFVNHGKIIHEAGTADGAIHLEDMNFSYVDVGVLRGWRNNGNCFGFKLSNWDKWSESNNITGRTVQVDRACVFDAFNGNSNSTTSQQDNYIHHFTAGQFYNRGFEMRADLSGASFVKCTAFNYNTGTIAYEFNGRCDGLSLVSPECEFFSNAGDNNTAYMFGTGPTAPFGNGPVVINPCLGQVSHADGTPAVSDGVHMTCYNGQGQVVQDGGTYYELTVSGGSPTANELDNDLEVI